MQECSGVVDGSVHSFGLPALSQHFYKNYINGQKLRLASLEALLHTAYINE